MMALGLLVAVGSTYGDMDQEQFDPESMYQLAGTNEGFGGSYDHNGDFYGQSDRRDDRYGDRDGRHDKIHDNYDWLNPGGYYSYSYWYYPSYSYYWYPSYAYNYPVTYTAPVVYPTHTYFYDPVVYDPWYAANVYGWTGSTYYYSSSWSWSRSGGYYFV